MSVYSTIIKNGRIVTGETIVQGDIAIKSGKITEVSTDKSIRGSADEVINAEGLHIFPGLIDTHVHFNEPGRTEWEGMETGSQSLAAGGTTTFFDMPLNSTPPVINRRNLDIKKTCAEEKAMVDDRFCG